MCLLMMVSHAAAVVTCVWHYCDFDGLVVYVAEELGSAEQKHHPPKRKRGSCKEDKASRRKSGSPSTPEKKTRWTSTRSSNNNKSTRQTSHSSSSNKVSCASCVLTYPLVCATSNTSSHHLTS